MNVESTFGREERNSHIPFICESIKNVINDRQYRPLIGSNRLLQPSSTLETFEGINTSRHQSNTRYSKCTNNSRVQNESRWFFDSILQWHGNSVRFPNRCQ